MNPSLFSPNTTQTPAKPRRERKASPFMGPFHGYFEWWLDFLTACDCDPQAASAYGAWITAGTAPQHEIGLVDIGGMHPEWNDEPMYFNRRELMVGLRDGEEWYSPGAEEPLYDVRRFMPLPSLEVCQAVVANLDEFTPWVDEVAALAAPDCQVEVRDIQAFILEHENRVVWKTLHRMLWPTGVPATCAALVVAAVYGAANGLEGPAEVGS